MAPSCNIELARFSARLRIQDGWLHLASWKLPGSQLRIESKTEQSVAKAQNYMKGGQHHTEKMYLGGNWGWVALDLSLLICPSWLVPAELSLHTFLSWLVTFWGAAPDLLLLTYHCSFVTWLIPPDLPFLTFHCWLVILELEWPHICFTDGLHFRGWIEFIYTFI